MERHLYPKTGSPERIIRFLDRTDRGVEVEVEKFVGFGKDNQKIMTTVTRFYPWTSVDYIETES